EAVVGGGDPLTELIPRRSALALLDCGCHENGEEVLLTEQDRRPESGLLNLGSLAAEALACTAQSPSAENMKLISQPDQFCCRSAFGPIP
ncbi:MAG: hypothetical protein RLZZ374_1914, partial [Cyanobacteriota bacterium]